MQHRHGPPPPVQATPKSKLSKALFPSMFFFQLLPLCAMCAVLSGSLVLRCMMFIFCVKEADWGMIAFVAYLAPWFSE